MAMELIVTSYNIHRGVGLDRRRDLARTADVIAETGAHVVGLQEVIREHGGPQADQAAYLARRLDMELVMGATRPHGAGTYGNAVLTRLPVLGSSACDLSRGRREPRGCLRVDLGANGRTLHVFNCHFGLALKERREQLGLLGGFLRDPAGLGGPRVLMGDFNEWHRGPITRGLRLEFSSPMRRMRRTHPALFPLFRLDRIYWDVELEGEEFHVHRSRLARMASDHLPVLARLRVRPRPAPRELHPYVVGDLLPPAE
jgi:endonuclease/exonuclease/phosphatase family metal-dependent hydrolase